MWTAYRSYNLSPNACAARSRSAAGHMRSDAPQTIIKYRRVYALRHSATYRKISPVRVLRRSANYLKTSLSRVLRRSVTNQNITEYIRCGSPRSIQVYHRIYVPYRSYNAALSFPSIFFSSRDIFTCDSPSRSPVCFCDRPP